eukprot:gene230-280_t
MVVNRKKRDLESESEASDEETTTTTTTTKTVQPAKKALKQTTLTSMTSTTTTATSGAPVGDDEKQKILDILTIGDMKTMTFEEFKPRFDQMANSLMNDVVLSVGGVDHMFVELEFYFKGYSHPDTFTHGDDFQQDLATWYFHRSGKTYKAASYKGLDITFGDGTAYAGILVRGIERVGGAACLVDGPSLCVDHLLAGVGAKDIQSYVDKHGRSLLPGDAPICLRVRDHSVMKKPAIAVPISSGRVGLTMKMVRANAEQYFGCDLRYIRLPDQIKKGKHYMNAALYKQGKTADQIKVITKSTLAAVNNAIRAFDNGMKATSKDALNKYRGAISNDDVCTMMGICCALEKIRRSGGGNTDAASGDQDDEDSKEEEGEEEEAGEDQDE